MMHNGMTPFKFIFKSIYVTSSTAFFLREFLFELPEQQTHTHNGFFQYYYIFCCLFQPSSGGILVHRKKAEAPLLTNNGYKFIVNIYIQQAKDIHHYKDIRKSFMKKQELLQIV